MGRLGKQKGDEKKEIAKGPVRAGPRLFAYRHDAVLDSLDSVLGSQLLARGEPAPESEKQSGDPDSATPSPSPAKPTEFASARVPLGVDAVGAPTMWAKGIDGAGVLVGVIDTGIMEHPDLKGRIVVSRNYTKEKSAPKNVHATHVAGTIAASGGLKGVAPGASLANYRVLRSDGSGDFDAIVTAVYDAVRDGCQVLNLSLGAPVDYPPLRAALQYAWSMNVLAVVAAGNEGDGDVATDELSYPAMYATTYSVGAASFEDGEVLPAAFSNSNAEVDCCSQGVSVLSTGNKGGYVVLSGTSMASPHVAGVAALIVHSLVRTRTPYDTKDLKGRLDALAKDVYLPGPDNATGKGWVTLAGH